MSVEDWVGSPQAFAFFAWFAISNQATSLVIKGTHMKNFIKIPAHVHKHTLYVQMVGGAASFIQHKEKIWFEQHLVDVR